MEGVDGAVNLPPTRVDERHDGHSPLAVALRHGPERGESDRGDSSGEREPLRRCDSDSQSGEGAWTQRDGKNSHAGDFDPRQFEQKIDATQQAPLMMSSGIEIQLSQDSLLLGQCDASRPGGSVHSQGDHSPAPTRSCRRKRATSAS